MISFPFNFDPESTVESGVDYTIPAGKFAIVTATLYVDAYISQAPISSGTSPAMTSDSNCATIIFQMNSGQVLTKSTTSASATLTGATGSIDSRSTASLLIDGTIISNISAGSAVSWASGSGTTGTISGSAVVSWSISIYNKLT